MRDIGHSTAVGPKPMTTGMDYGSRLPLPAVFAIQFAGIYVLTLILMLIFVDEGTVWAPPLGAALVGSGLYTWQESKRRAERARA